MLWKGTQKRRLVSLSIDVGRMRTGFLKKLVINGHLHNTQEIRLALDGAGGIIIAGDTIVNAQTLRRE